MKSCSILLIQQNKQRRSLHKVFHIFKSNVQWCMQNQLNTRQIYFDLGALYFSFFLCFYHFTRPPSPLCLQPINFHFICCMTYKFYNRLQLGMYNSQFVFFFKIHRVRGNSWTITKFRDLC